MRAAITLLLVSLSTHASILRGGGSGSAPSSCTGTPNAIAACFTAKNNPLCSASAMGDYFAEIGNSSGPLWSAQVGTSIGRTSVVQLDSASKGVITTYRVQVQGGLSGLSIDSIAHLHQQSGYVAGPSKCPVGKTVISCLAATPGVSCGPTSGYIINGTVVPTNGYGALCTSVQGLYTYNGENFQTEAAFDGPSSFYNAGRTGVATAVNAALNLTGSNQFSYSEPLLAGAADNSVAGVAAYLEQVLSGALLMNGALGAYPVCTNFAGNPNIARNTNVPTEIAGSYIGQRVWNGTNGSPFGFITVTSSTTIGTGPNGPWIKNGICQSNATGNGSSPIPENWTYVLGMWQESDPASNGDGAFSDPGAKGFVTWIDASKTYYGIIGRVNATGGVGYQSEQCGRLLRHAFITSTIQTGVIPTP